VKPYLITKLLMINLIVIGFVMVIVWLAVDTLAAGYFVTLMEKYHISPGPAHAMFVGAIHRYLIWACLAAVLLSVVLSYLMLRRVLSPLTRMTGITREIAAGNFTVRVPALTKDEVGQLAAAFNKMAASLEELENLRRTLMIDVAHELRTPLTNIRGYLEALSEGVVSPTGKTFRLLLDETLRLVQLVEDVLQLARADTAKGILDLQPTDIAGLLKQVLETFSWRFTQKDLEINTRAPLGPVTVAVDRDFILRVLRNLTDNAARYTPANNRIDILIEPWQRFVKVLFRNPAEELLAEDLPYLFERFYRGEKSRSRQHGGAGIGLAIVKEIINAHGGSVGAELVNGCLQIWIQLPVDMPNHS
jgi:two-component system sensor histidine kinase BaeS